MLENLAKILTNHVSSKQAITSLSLAKLLDSTDRKVRLGIRELISRGYPIASTVRPPYGYFIVANRQEADDYMRNLKSRLIEDALRRADFKKAASNLFDKGNQLKLV